MPTTPRKPATRRTAASKTAATAAPKAATARSPRTPGTARGAKAAPAAASGLTPVVLSVRAEPGLSVFVAGSFNNWDPSALPMTEARGVYSATLELASGIYEYKFVIDGVWTLDPDPSRDWTQNGLGTLNSVLRVN